MVGTINGIDYMASEDSNVTPDDFIMGKRALGGLYENITFNNTVTAGDGYINVTDDFYYMSSESDTFINCTFKNGIFSSASGDGGDGNITLENCIVSGNTDINSPWVNFTVKNSNVELLYICVDMSWNGEIAYYTITDSIVKFGLHPANTLNDILFSFDAGWFNTQRITISGNSVIEFPNNLKFLIDETSLFKIDSTVKIIYY